MISEAGLWKTGAWARHIMNKKLEIVLLGAFCLLSLLLGWFIGRAAQNVGIALFFYLLAAFFFLAMFRPHTR